MPNWCQTDYIISGPDARKVYDLVDNLDKKLGLKNDFGAWWLGNLLHVQGLDWQKIPCRGHIDFCDLEDDETMIMSTETAWQPMNECIHKAIYEKFNVNISFSAEECGTEQYISNDPVFVDTYILNYECTKSAKFYERSYVLGLEDHEVIEQLTYVFNKNDILTDETMSIDELIKLGHDNEGKVFEYFRCNTYKEDNTYFN